MPHVWVEVEENENCHYSPLQTFELKGPLKRARVLVLLNGLGRRGPCEVIGWAGPDKGSPCPVRYALVGDSGAGTSLLIAGGDYGIRMRPLLGSGREWDLRAEDQWGEPYLLLDPEETVQAVDDHTDLP